MGKFYSPKKLVGIAKNVVAHPGRTAARAAIAYGTLGASLLLPQNLQTGSINPAGTPISRGDVVTPPKALAPAAALPTSPQLSALGSNKRRRKGGTLLTGSQGLTSTPAAGKTLLGA